MSFGTRHGFDGWLNTIQADAKLVATDFDLVKVLASPIQEGKPLSQVPWFNNVGVKPVNIHLDPNEWGAQEKEGMHTQPLSIRLGEMERCSWS